MAPNFAKRPFRNWLSDVQLIEQRLRLFQIERVETLRKPAVNRSEQFARLLWLPLIAPEPRHAHRRAQFPVRRSGRWHGLLKTLLCRQAWQFRKRGVERRLVQVAIVKLASEVIRIGLHVEVTVA